MKPNRVKALLIPLVWGLVFPATALTAEQQSQIETSGQGKIFAVPDMAYVSFTFSERNKDAAPARKMVDEQIDSFLTILKRLNIKRSDIQASRFTIHPEFDYKRDRQLVGYRVTRDVRITLRDLGTYAKLLDGAVTTGVSNTGNLQLDFSNREELEDKAMQAAFGRAKAKASLLAEEANGSLGNAVWISETGGSGPPPPVPARMMMAEAADASYPTGELEIRKQIHVRFEFVPQRDE